MAKSLLVAVVAVSVAAGVAVGATGHERHDAIYPGQRIPLVFSHSVHVKPESQGGVGAPCEACHEAAPNSEKASDVLLPKAGPERPEKGWPEHEACEACHDIENASQGKQTDPKASCETCHLGFEKTKKVAPAVFPQANLVFNHKIHFDRMKDIKCETCHFGSSGEGMQEVELSTRYQLPKMKTCLDCHNGSTAPADCKTCHLTDPSGRLQVMFASANLKPMQGDPLGLDHGPRYEFTHGTRAKIDRQACGECHSDSYCVTCHDSLQKPLSVHPNDFISLHPVQAKMDSTACEACHRFQSFCAACHERVGIGFNADPTLRARNLQVHPGGMAFIQTPGPEHHSVAASRDPKQCMACHREETCIRCHASNKLLRSSQSVNPHPDGFAARCKSLRQANDRACLKCHEPNDLAAKPGCQ